MAIVAGVLFVAVLVAAGVGLTATRQTVTDGGQTAAGAIPDPPADSSSGLVYGLQATSAWSIGGLVLRSSQYVAQVGFVVPPECVSLDESGNEELLSTGRCGDLPAHGELSGGGITKGGLKLAIVSLPVSKRCYEALAAGAVWPPATEACADDANARP